ncbi:MAG: hypothetical protein RIS70_384 [Planctomycetota bacterium]
MCSKRGQVADEGRIASLLTVRRGGKILHQDDSQIIFLRTPLAEFGDAIVESR